MQAQCTHSCMLYILPSIYASVWRHYYKSKPPAPEAFDALRWFKRYVHAKVQFRRPDGPVRRGRILRGSQTVCSRRAGLGKYGRTVGRSPDTY
eukprot:595687-Heterocapsa_arctica.AAC.1